MAIKIWQILTSVLVLIIIGGVSYKWVYDKEHSTLYKDDDIIARHRWAIQAERTYIVKNSWYRTNVMCPRIIGSGGYETATRCYYPDDYYEDLKRNLINTKVTTEDLIVKRDTPFYKYGTRGAYAGILKEVFGFIDTEKIEEFPRNYTISFDPKDTRNYKLIWRVWELKDLDLPDGNYTDCIYNFGKIRIDLKNECSKLERAEVKDDRIWFYFRNIKGEQILNVNLVDPEISECGELSSANSVYTLTQNVQSDETCFTISAQNVTLDCQGYTINFSVTGINYRYGIYSNQYNTTIKNCVIENANSSARFTWGVYFGGNNGTIYNNTITTHVDFDGPCLYIGSDSNSITYNTLVTNDTDGYGIRLSSAHRNVMSNNMINTSGPDAPGIQIFQSHYNTMSNNIINTNLSTGIYLDSNSDYNIVNNNTITSRGANGRGFRVEEGSDFNTFSNSTLTVWDSEAIFLVDDSTGNTFSGLEVYAYDDPAIYIFYANNNFTFQDSILNSSKAGTVELYTSKTTEAEWNFTNVTRSDGSHINISWSANTNATLNMKWWLEVEVTSGPNPLEGANISVWDVNNNLQFSELTDSSGKIKKGLLEYKNENNTLITYYSNYTINTTKAGYITNSQSINLTTNQKIDVDYPTMLADCGILDTAGTTYYLTQDITDSSATKCMDITANNITLDCQGYTIDGDDGAVDYGIYVYRNPAETTNITIRNCTLTDWGFKGIMLYQSNGNLIDNTSISSSETGLSLYRSSGNEFKNSVFSNNDEWDFHVSVLSAPECDNELINITGTDNKPIIYYNETVTIGDWDNNVSELILCDADNSIINNLTLDHTDIKNNGLLLEHTSDSNITNSSFTDLYIGIQVGGYSNSNIIENITSNSNSYGVYFIAYSDSNILKSSGMSNNSVYGIYSLSSDLNSIINNTITNNTAGILMSNTGQHGADLIYNNLLNNSNNVVFTAPIYTNSWNTSKQTGIRIYSDGTQSGGNYWYDYSETCIDLSKDGFCDLAYDVENDAAGCTSDNCDYFPLSDEYDGTGPIVNITYPVNNSIQETTSIGLNWTGSDDIYIDWCGYSLDGGANNTAIAEKYETSFYGYGIDYDNHSASKSGNVPTVPKLIGIYNGSDWFNQDQFDSSGSYDVIFSINISDYLNHDVSYHFPLYTHSGDLNIETVSYNLSLYNYRTVGWDKVVIVSGYDVLDDCNVLHANFTLTSDYISNDRTNISVEWYSYDDSTGAKQSSSASVTCDGIEHTPGGDAADIYFEARPFVTSLNFTNITLTGLSEIDHNITIYCNDSNGNIGQSDYIYFTTGGVSINVTLGEGISGISWRVPFYTGTTAYNINATGQNNTVGLFRATNNGTLSGSLSMRFNDTYWLGWCYQEYTNTTTNCGGRSTGVYASGGDI